jgi:exonuclease III
MADNVLMMATGFTILQWNAQSLIAHGGEFKKHIHSLTSAPNVICVQETFLKDNLSFSLSGYNILRKDRDVAREGVATFIKKDYLTQ